MLIRFATPRDVPAIVGLISDLADYEQLAHETVARDQDIHDALFTENPHVFCHVAESDGKVVGLALWFLNFSTFHGSSGLYLEDLYVREDLRGQGIGTALMSELAQLCVARGYTRFQWWVLDWNNPSIEFYKSIGAVAMDEWTVFRLSGDPLRAFGEGPRHI
jgi:GNAT superfamily N-acetyltransferase